MPDDKLPPSPLTELAASVAQWHEAFRAMVEQGFTEAQAMQLLIAVITSGIRR